MSDRIHVDKPGPLLRFLELRLPGWHRNTLKQRLRLGCIFVNKRSVTRHDHPLESGDEVEIVAKGEGVARQRSRHGFTTLYLDDDLVAIDKPAGLLCVSTDREQTRAALSIVRRSLSSPRRPAELWPVHRLDRETSGVLLFARSREVCEAVQATWTRASKVYLAVVEGHPEPDQGVVDKPLWEDRSLNVRVGRRPDARDARTRFRTRRVGHHRALLEVELETGRRHQIRVHMAWVGHPIVGDKRYGTGGPRMGLHALRLTVFHPRDGRSLVLEAPPPQAFSALLDARKPQGGHCSGRA